AIPGKPVDESDERTLDVTVRVLSRRDFEVRSAVEDLEGYVAERARARVARVVRERVEAVLTGTGDERESTVGIHRHHAGLRLQCDLRGKAVELNRVAVVREHARRGNDVGGSHRDTEVVRLGLGRIVRRYNVDCDWRERAPDATD